MPPHPWSNTHGHFDHIGGNADKEKLNLSRQIGKQHAQHSDYWIFEKNDGVLIGAGLCCPGLLAKNLPKLNREMENQSPCENHVSNNRLPTEGFLNLATAESLYVENTGTYYGPAFVCFDENKRKSLFTGDMLWKKGVVAGI